MLDIESFILGKKAGNILNRPYTVFVKNVTPVFVYVGIDGGHTCEVEPDGEYTFPTEIALKHIISSLEVSARNSQSLPLEFDGFVVKLNYEGAGEGRYLEIRVGM